MEYEIRPAGKFSLGLRELWEFRELFYFFTWRDIKIKYKQTVLGAAWAILQPLLMMVIFTLFFSRTLNIPSNNIPYPIFVFSGLLLWNVFATSLTNAGNSMVNNANIIKKIYFPRLIIPISSVLSALADFVMALVVYFALLIYYHDAHLIPQLLLVLPLSIFITILSSFGLGSFLAAVNVKYRDFRYVIPFLIQILIFLTPIIYPVSIIKIPWVVQLLQLNPMAGAIELLRSVINQSSIDWILTAKSLFISFLLLFTGVFYFRKTEYYFADLA